MPTISGLIVCIFVFAPLGSSQFNPRFQPGFAPSPAFPQRNMPPFGDFGSYGLFQMPPYGPNNRFAPQAPYGSPLFSSNDMPMMEQNMFMAPPSYSRRPAFAQFGGQAPPMNPIMPMHQPNGMLGAGLPPAFASLNQPFAMNPIAGKSPYQREAGVQMNSMPGAFNDLEPFQTLPNAEITKQKRSTTKN